MNSAKNIFSNIGSKVLLYPLSFLVSMITTRILGPNDKGVIGFTMTFVSLATVILSFGFAMGMHYEIGSQRYKVKVIFWTTLIMGLLTGSFISAITWLIYVGNIFPILCQLNSIHILMLNGVIIFGITQSFLLRIMTADNQFILTNKIQVALGLIQPILLLLFIWFWDMGLYGALMSACLLGFVGTLLFMLSIIHKYGLIPFTFSIDFVKASLSYGIKSWLADTTYMATLRLDQLMLGFFLQAYELGLYAVAVVLSELLWVIPDGVNAVLLNKMIRPDQSIDEKIMLASRIFKTMFLSMSILGTMIFFVAKYVLIPYGYGITFTESVNPLGFLIPGAIGLILAKVLTKILTGTGLVLETTKAVIISSIVQVALYVVLIPRFGIIGAAIASSIGYIFLSVITLLFSNKVYNNTIVHFTSWTRADFSWMYHQLKALPNMLQR